MDRTSKSNSISALAEHLRRADGVILSHYRGLSVAQLQALRRALGGGVQHQVTKNTLARIAVRTVGAAPLDAQLAGPTALTIIYGDVAVASAVLHRFAAAHPRALVVGGGYVEGQVVSAGQVARLAGLGSRQAVLTRLATALHAPGARLHNTFIICLSQPRRLAQALHATRGEH